MNSSIRRILIANRGEIACRIIHTCRDLGIETIAVYSEADQEALHVKTADLSYAIGPPAAQKSYLNMDAVLSAAQSLNADAIHPGYGFLAENAQFAENVLATGLYWIGPKPVTIASMGDKQKAREIAKVSNIPVLTGSPRISPNNINGASDIAHSIGFPLLIKATAGGGGIGMQRVDELNNFERQILTAQNLAERSFGDPTVYLERYIADARHIEVQIFGFGDGNGVHLFDRDCSIQRRFQKIIEEAPAAEIPRDIREKMHSAALALVREVRYAGAGTVEFIYDRTSNEFFFLEMNTRIQVEHAVTEMVTGLDLIAWQINLARGEFLTASQAKISCGGAAIEARVYAERPEKGFLPSPGKIITFDMPPLSSNLRIDTGVQLGDEITPYYDPMIAKVIAKGKNRREAINTMRSALQEVHIAGPSTNLAYLKQIFSDPDYITKPPSTAYVEEHPAKP